MENMRVVKGEIPNLNPFPNQQKSKKSKPKFASKSMQLQIISSKKQSRSQLKVGKKRRDKSLKKQVQMIASLKRN